MSLNGTVVKEDKGENEKLYGKPLATKQIIDAKVATPPGARVLISALERYTSES